MVLGPPGPWSSLAVRAGSRQRHSASPSPFRSALVGTPCVVIRRGSPHETGTWSGWGCRAADSRATAESGPSSPPRSASRAPAMLPSVTPTDEAAARALFFAYEGSTFYMSRDGSDREFAAMQVPRALRERWLKEMTEERLASMGGPGGWRSVNFLWHHGVSGHLPAVLGHAPLGKPWERTAYLELAAKYAEQCASKGEIGATELRSALRAIQARVGELQGEYRMRGQRDRLARLDQQLGERVSE